MTKKTNNGRMGEKSTSGAPINFQINLHSVVSVVFSIPSSVQSKMMKNCSYFTADPVERRGAKEYANRELQ